MDRPINPLIQEGSSRMDKFRPLGQMLAASALSLLAFVPAHAATPNPRSAVEASHWVGAWATAPFDGDPWHHTPTLMDSTVREIVHTTLAGKELRIRFTNEFGKEPLQIDAANVSLSSGGSSVNPGSMHSLTFGGKPSIVIPPGAEVVSDAVDMATPAFTNLAITFFLPLQQITTPSVHTNAAQDNYVQPGDEIADDSLAAAKVSSEWFFIKGVDVVPTQPHAAAVVAFGDSITDGAWVTENSNHRWPDFLAQRLHGNPSTAHLSVLNEGIGGNCVLIHCVGPNALERLDRDVFGQAGVKYMIVLESINDIGALHNPNQPDYKLTAADLEQGLSQIVARAHEHGIKVFGATLTPYKGAGYYTERGEQIREQVNQWILTSGVFDGTVDFDKAVSNPAEALTYLKQYDSGDHLHPNDNGYSAMANAIALSLFQQ